MEGGLGSWTWVNKFKVSVPCCCCCPRRSCRSSVASLPCQKSSRLRVIAARIDPFSLLISLYNATKLLSLSVFTSNLETICYKRCSKSLLKNTKIPRRVDVRRLKTSLLKTWGGLLLFSFPPKKENWSAPGGIPTKFHAWRLRPKIVQPLTFYIPFLTEKVPLSSYTFSFLTAVNARSLKYDKITKQQVFLDMFSQSYNASVSPFGLFYRPKWQVSLSFHILQQGKPATL